MARAQLRFTPCERFALQLFRLAARGGAAAALQTSNVSVRQFVKSLRYANYHIQYIYIYRHRPSAHLQPFLRCGKASECQDRGYNYPRSQLKACNQAPQKPQSSQDWQAQTGQLKTSCPGQPAKIPGTFPQTGHSKLLARVGVGREPELAALELEGRAIESYISAYSFDSTLSYRHRPSAHLQPFLRCGKASECQDRGYNYPRSQLKACNQAPQKPQSSQDWQAQTGQLKTSCPGQPAKIPGTFPI